MLQLIRQSLYTFKRAWLSRRNPTLYARWLGVTVGERCRLIDAKSITFGSEPFLIVIGNHVTVAQGVSFLTHDGAVDLFRHESPLAESFAPISVGDNSFIGQKAILMPGVRIGTGCVIGAGAVVTKDVPDGCVAAGVPARILCRTEDWWTKTQPSLLHLRGLPPARKREALLEHFADELDARARALSGASLNPHESKN